MSTAPPPPPPGPAPGPTTHTFNGPPGMTLDQQKAFVQAQMQHQAQLEHTKQQNLQRAQTLPSIDDEPFTPLPFTINRTEHSLSLPPDFVSSPSLVQGDPSPQEILDGINSLAKLFKTAPPQAIPPPPQKIDQGRSAQVVKLKDEGNAKFKARSYDQSILLYSASLAVASQRMPWEASGIFKEEMSTVLCNRSAAYGAMGDWPASYADADAVVKMKRPWSKGHFRKAKALLGLSRPQDALTAINLGLEYEPSSIELLAFRDEILAALKAEEEERRREELDSDEEEGAGK
ncbi:hypothetical protein BDY24DRAFT_386083 [Mrakia frigida]|uniref:uncharacterized protein n=1 Tax=Mrakia frigida TaxID=29902 RepID=UPI003FCBF22C